MSETFLGDEFHDELAELQYALLDAKTVYHERYVYDQIFSFLREHGQDGMAEVLEKSYKYAEFKARYEGQLLYNKTINTLPKPLRWLVSKFQ